MTLPPSSTVGAVRLRVADLATMTSFYERALGLDRLDDRGTTVRLGVEALPVVELVQATAGRRREPTTGLFHLAVVVPTRAALGGAIRRVLDSDWGFTGAADHLVSEAVYLDDPEGNGIEIYRDRPRDDWRYDDGGSLRMATLHLDVESILAEPGARDEGPRMPAGTRMGHVHLQVAELVDTESFYAGILGFDVMVRSYPGALFVSAGGYHHHLGLNTWASRGAPAPPPGSPGLDRYEIRVGDEAELDEIQTRLDEGGVLVERDEAGLHTADPSGNRILVCRSV